MRTHYKVWLDYSNKKSSVTLSVDATQRIPALLTSQVGCPPEIPTALPQLLSETVSAPRNPPEPTENPWQLQRLLTDHRLAQSALQYSYGDRREEPRATAPRDLSAQQAAEVSRAGKCPATDECDGDPLKKKNKARTCTYCKSIECKGKWGMKYCLVKEQVDQRCAATSLPEAVPSGSNVTLDAAYFI
ncbi:hypothetical protein DEU56DRAFT_760193 [Suillus clintonianus]|uniref:uncharacterized protein n=1 Tax=Suillus clintonianus TaxID=1904413 RepID=UPI001B85C1AC|nr:uncharacterized protein DEU56DRAFT_760193 [Suillus clintonianus]KAG2122915.1 hypothetical protein DEU56DRAFT_760193 [Suillus clintonianus]